MPITFRLPIIRVRATAEFTICLSYPAQANSVFGYGAPHIPLIITLTLLVLYVLDHGAAFHHELHILQKTYVG